MIKIALTGNIASGKSTVEKIISDSGYKIIDADFICHELLSDKTVINKIRKIFHAFDILDENDNVNRKIVAEIIFANNDYKVKLEKLLHPLIKIEIEKFITNNEEENVIFVSVPLLFETKMENMFDKIVLVVCNEDVRLKRLMQRSNCTKEHAKLRINAQIPEITKIGFADFVIDNNSNLENLKINTQNFLNELATTLNG